MTDHDAERSDEHSEHHGEDAGEKPAGGSKQEDNPEHGEGTGEGEGGLGTQTGAAGGAEPVEPADTETSKNQSK